MLNIVIFFVNEKPKLLAVYEALVPWSRFSKIYFNDVLVLYRHFPNKKALRQSPFKFFNIKYAHCLNFVPFTFTSSNGLNKSSLFTPLLLSMPLSWSNF